MNINDNIKVNFYHHRNGRIGTSCSILVNNRIDGFSRAICGPNDTFNKKVGRKVALDKALKDSTLSKADRTLVWDKFKATVNW